MRLSSVISIIGSFVLAFGLCAFAASFAVDVIEEASRHDVRDRLDENGMTWTEIDADGLQVFLAGTAPSEAVRFKALSIAGSVVEPARIIDQMLVQDTADIAPPRFSVEILRNDSGLSLIGLIPASTDRDELLKDVAYRARNDAITDLLESADYEQPETWQDALEFGVAVLDRLLRAKVSIESDRIRIVAMADSDQAKLNLETELTRKLPEGIRLELDISAPRPVVTPFTLRYLLEDGEGRFDACSADTEEARDRIVSAAGRAGLAEKSECVLALGVPSPNWSRAAELSIEALAELGGGSVTFVDADIALVAAKGTPEAQFDDVIGKLDIALPSVFALKAVLPKEETDTPVAKPDFVATLSPEGLVQIRGRVDSKVTRDMVDSFAKAKFASDVVNTTARVAENLPKDWTKRILTALETLAYLSNGAVIVEPDLVTVRGQTGNSEASADISALLAEKLGETGQFDIKVTYQEALDPVASLPTPEECEAKIAEVQVGRKITFEPGEATIDANGLTIMDDIAEILKACGEIRMEIGGHTDSQGREVMNQQLSQARAQAVLNELRARRVLTSSIRAKGYGESLPIATNDTEDGREANRRIEFKVIRPEPIKEQKTTLEALEEAAQNAQARDDNSETADQAEEPVNNEQN